MHSPKKTEKFSGHSVEGLLSEIGLRGRRELSLLKKPIFLDPGSYLVRSGENPHCIFIHRLGVIETTPSDRMDDQPEPEKGVIEGVYGLAETLSDADFDFSIRSVTNCEFDVIDRDDLLQFLRRHPELIQKLNTAFSTLYRTTVNQIREQ